MRWKKKIFKLVCIRKKRYSMVINQIRFFRGIVLHVTSTILLLWEMFTEQNRIWQSKRRKVEGECRFGKKILGWRLSLRWIFTVDFPATNRIFISTLSRWDHRIHRYIGLKKFWAGRYEIRSSSNSISIRIRPGSEK